MIPSVLPSTLLPETSRHHGLPVRTLVVDGVAVPYLARRFPPAPGDMIRADRHVVGPADRIDLMAHAAYGDATQFWRLADAAAVFDPLELEVPGRRLDVPLAGPAFRLLEDEPPAGGAT